MIVNRDYGYLVGTPSNKIPNNLVEVTLRKQVYQATHRGDDKRLPFMNRSFISFTFGGKFIEDFDLIATTSGDRLNRTGYATFEDNTTTYSNLDGLRYWGTHYRNNSMEFTLSTDGIDLKKLDDFLHWFMPGITRELILAEHPNRVINARVSEPPELLLLPFEGTTSMKIDEMEFLVHTTLYKGDIILKFVMDYPFWHSKDNILGKKVDDGSGLYRYEDSWTDLSNLEVLITESADALKILYEDGIPLGSMIQCNMLLGNGAYARVEEEEVNKIWEKAGEPDYDPTDGISLSYDWITWNPSGHGEGARISNVDDTTGQTIEKLGIIAGAIVDADGNGIITLEPKTPAYFFYAGNAPAPTIIKFTILPLLDDSTGYVSFFGKKEGTQELLDEATITIKCVNELRFKLTMPTLYRSYNRALKLFDEKSHDDPVYGKIVEIEDYEDFRLTVRETIKHPAVRNWTIKVVDWLEMFNDKEILYETSNIDEQTGKINYVNEIRHSNSAYSRSREWVYIKLAMTNFLLNPIDLAKPTSQAPYPAEFMFDSSNGDAIGVFNYRTIYPNVMPDRSVDGWYSYDGIKSEDRVIKKIEENVGDMVLSNYIFIKERNYADEYGRVTSRSEGGEDGRGLTYSHEILHDFSVPLENLSIIYENLYL